MPHRRESIAHWGKVFRLTRRSFEPYDNIVYIYLLYYFGCGYLHLIVCMPIDGKQGPSAASQLSFFTQWSSQAEMATLILQPIYVANFE